MWLADFKRFGSKFSNQGYSFSKPKSEAQHAGQADLWTQLMMHKKYGIQKQDAGGPTRHRPRNKHTIRDSMARNLVKPFIEQNSMRSTVGKYVII